MTTDAPPEPPPAPPKQGYRKRVPQAKERPTAAVVLGIVLAAVVFVVLPLTQLLNLDGREDDELLVGATVQPPPPPPPKFEPPEPEVEEIPEPEINEPPPAIDLTNLELALGPSLGEGVGTAALPNFEQETDVSNFIFSLGEVDNLPVIIRAVQPVKPPEAERRNLRGSVAVVFIVDERGNVVDPSIDESSQPAFNRAVLDAIRQFKFRPATKAGQPVSVTVRQRFEF